MLADDEGVDASRIDVEPASDEVTQSRGVEHRAAAEYAVGRVARQFVRDVGQHVDGVGNDEQERAVVVLDYFGNYRVEYGDVLFDYIEPSFARFLIDACGYYDDAAVGEVGVSACAYLHGLDVRLTVREVHRFADSAVAVDVDEYHIGEHAAFHKRKSDGRADHAAAYYTYFPDIHTVNMACRRYNYARGKTGLRSPFACFSEQKVLK